MRRFALTVVLMLTCLLWGANLQAVTYYVTDDFPTIQDALNGVSAGDEIIVRNGVYTENLVWPSTAGITLRSESDDPSTCVIDGDGMDSVIVIDSGIGTGTIIRGFTIRNGSGTGAASDGGGFYLSASSPTIQNNTITSNVVNGNGGGIYCQGGSPVIQGNDITGNASYEDTIGGGGGLFFDSGSALVEGNTISGNTVLYQGAGLYAMNSDLTIRNNTIDSNDSNTAGGGLYLRTVTGTIEDNTIEGNSSDRGAGIYCYSSSPTIWNNLIIDNISSIRGGGITCYESSPMIINNTLSGNSAAVGGGGMQIQQNSSPLIVNNIIAFTLDREGIRCVDGSSPSISNNDVYQDPSNSDPAYGGDCTDQTGLNGNISADPVFSAGYHLTVGSPCIDAGDNSAFAPLYDFEDDFRKMDGDFDTTIVVDMGADEYCASVDNDADTYEDCDDCDDNDNTSYPGAVEVCDYADNDCDSEIDEGVSITVYEDSDGDEYGDPATAIPDCSIPGGYVDNGADCDDGDPDSYPGAAEFCDGEDNDCNGQLPANEANADNDGFMICEGDCNDANNKTYPGATEICDGQDNDCSGGVPATENDLDGDGYRVCQNDCDDSDPGINPGEYEDCFDGIDNDCDTFVDFQDPSCISFCTDRDGDGYKVEGGSCGPVDCDDGNPFTYTGAAEICDGLDNNCDEALPSNENDADLDGWMLCENDCNDANGAINPAAIEVCDDLTDNDCDGDIDYNDGDCISTTDLDGDGYKTALEGGSDCVDDPSGDPPICDTCLCGDEECAPCAACINPAGTEFCDGIDNNCDGQIDESLDIDQDGLCNYEDNCEFVYNPSQIDSDVDGIGDACENNRVFYVDCNQTGDFEAIQSAIDYVSNSDRVVVLPCTYVENVDFDAKLITLVSRDGPDTTIIDGDRNGSVVTFDSGETRNAVLDGFTITNGSATGTSITKGGGIYALNSSPSIIGNIVIDNIAEDLGGPYTQGGGIYFENSFGLLQDNKVLNNSAVYGSGIYLRVSYSDVFNNIVYGNTSATLGVPGSLGGGMLVFGGQNRIYNNTVAYNYAETVGGICSYYGSSLNEIYNNSITNNFCISGGGLGNISGGVPPDNDYNNVWGNQVTNYGGNTSPGPNDISANPLYVDPDGADDTSGTADDDFHLQSNSPCIDVGNNSLADLPYFDFEGDLRIIDGNSDWVTVIDIGADEFCFDIDADGDGFTDCGEDCDDNDTDDPSICDTCTCDAPECASCAVCINPGVSETEGAGNCSDGIDNDCDGMIDTDPDCFAPDQDEDGYGDADFGGSDCNDDIAGDDPICDLDGPDPCACGEVECGPCARCMNPGATEICDLIDNNCDGQVDEGFDADGDGIKTCDEPPDCDDNDAETYPGGDEVCDFADNNCNGEVDEGFDVDEDTWSVCENDCNDNDPSINPGTIETGALCSNSIDDNCDTYVDMDDPNCDCWDNDNDQYGDPPGLDCLDPYLWDCNDFNGLIHPGMPELGCDDLDNNCNGQADEGFDQDGDGVQTCEGDCDDNDAGRSPLNTEVCDLKDNDCDDIADEGFDQDGDTFTSCNGDCDDNPAQCGASCFPGGAEVCDGYDNNCDGQLQANEVDADNDLYMLCEGDCDDTNPTVCPACPEVCDGADNDCNSQVDEGFDADGDGYSWCTECDDDDTDDDPICTTCVCEFEECSPCARCINPDADEECDLVDNDCDSVVDEGYDQDSDGYNVCGDPVDCDDTNPNRYPGNSEVCDRVDNDCNGGIPADETDDDGDGYTECEGDCADGNATRFPGAAEACNGIDDDCDGSTDEGFDEDGDGFTSCGGDCDDANPNQYPGNPEVCDRVDNDCNGVIPANETDDDSDGYTECEGDCSDGNPSRFPGAAELCDGIDNDCDGSVDEGFDQDGDNWTSCGGDCNDAKANTYPGAPEVCDRLDNNCDGQVPAGETDGDGDGYADCEGDCHDQNSLINPDAQEICDGVDNDCDGLIDENVTITYYQDADGDGYGNVSANQKACSPPQGYVLDYTDCNDTNAAINPGVAEDATFNNTDCDGLDNDCDGVVDEWGDADSDNWTWCGGDCDDLDQYVFPGAFEFCDETDNDCDGVVDEDYDQDGDGYTTCDDQDPGYDCNDYNPQVYPGAPENCGDFLDNDCDGLVDFNDTLDCVCWDNDGDNYDDAACLGDDCDDSNAVVYVGADEICDGEDNDCNGQLPPGEADSDGDGSMVCEGDCDDNNANRSPLKPELCSDGIDNDCDDVIDEDTDEDGDSYTVCGSPADCDDNNILVNPGATEYCNDGIDNDCDGLVDYYDLLDCPCPDYDGDGQEAGYCGGDDCNDANPQIYLGAVERCNGFDDNCDGQVPVGEADADSDGSILCDGDCDDDPLDDPAECDTCVCGEVECGPCARCINPDAPELCDMIDNDCDGQTDENSDEDGDGYSVCGDPADCNDVNASVYPGAFEICSDYLDNDCDGLVDYYDVEDCPCPDFDGDGYDSDECGGDDCNDGNPGMHPGATELCNGVDDDCDGQLPADEQDADNDSARICQGDCDDNNPNRSPFLVETCDGVDNDCDGAIDENMDEDGDGYTVCGNPPDCNDNNALVYPGATERCEDGIDNDCDGSVDYLDTDCPCIDNDGDSYLPEFCGGDDCDDTKPGIHPDATELCNGIDDDCDDIVPANEMDADGDGFRICEGDCDDMDAGTNPDAPEVCDGEDNDCDGSIDENSDEDGDGYTVCGAPADCNDLNALVYPGAVELCTDGLDNDCDGDVDWDDSDCSCPDADSDGYTALFCGGDDCDDTLPGVYPGADERCNGLDDDCDDVVPANEADFDGDGFRVCENDCDDGNASRNPDAPEVCDGVDNDCDTLVDENSDEDGDGYSVCGTPADCNDTSALVYPGAVELCTDGLDNDCDGDVDWDDSDCSCPDADSDGYTALFCGGDDCDDTLPGVYPGAAERCNGIDDNCDGSVPANEADADGDGVRICNGDCNDNDPDISPNAPEVCDGVDNDCDTLVDENSDEDGDGYTVCGSPADCNDTSALVYPGAVELCTDGIDNDCDGDVDYDDSDCVCLDTDGDSYTSEVCGGDDCDDSRATMYPGADEICNALDDDCDGNVPANEMDIDGDGFRVCENDCDDNDVNRHPNAPELCDGVDNDCDGLTDENSDEDGDGYTVCGSPADCNDGNAQVYPGATEVCGDFLDNNCDGLTDYEDTVTCQCTDGDGDSYLPEYCGGSDCNDGSNLVYPGADELCNGFDDNCDDVVPLGEADADNDGYRLCDGDCDDNNPNRRPDAPELCNGIDDDCDGQIDENSDQDGDTFTVCGDPPDCNDLNALVYPGALELCYDGLDNDCDGLVDYEDSDVCICSDNDGDSYAAEFCGGDDCDDSRASMYPGAVELCNGFDDDCDGQLPGDEADIDNDGVRICEGDCDDNDPNRNPDAPELCNGVDDDCDGQIDENSDADGDGYSVCGDPADCNDNNANVHPGASELCSDGYDNDCNGLVDYDDIVPCPCPDNDADGYTAEFCGGDDCDDSLPGVHPNATELCNGVDDDCDTVVPLDETDADGDGVRICGGDCDDTDPDRSPNMPELCNGIDDDCDGAIDENSDQDGDGYTVCGNPADCNDNNALVYPGAIEICTDGQDNDCNGLADYEDTLPCPCLDGDGDGYDPVYCGGDDCDDESALAYPGATELCNGFDDDCNGSISAGENDVDNDGYMVCEGDCDDNDADRNPGAPELCNGIDDDCDGTIDENSDADGDGFTVCGAIPDCNDNNALVYPGADESCVDSIDNDCDGLIDYADTDDCTCPDYDEDGYTWDFCGGTDCNDSNPSVHPGANEVCNGQDDNCNGSVPPDETDHDNDGWRICAGDCDDTRPTVYPDAPEICDGLDNDCDGQADDSLDNDNDGFSICSSPVPDCNDNDPEVYPGAFEVCDNQDNDCDGVLDEGHDEDGDGWTWCGGDCADNDPNINPEVYEHSSMGNCDDGKDNDCDDDIDIRDSGCACVDFDGDGHINANCPEGDDCNDANPQVYPGRNEVCNNNIDDDCDTLVDCEDEECVNNDADGDGHYPVPCGGDCDDEDPDTYPGAVELCDMIDNNCDQLLPAVEQDWDNDGLTPCEGDCDDTNPWVHPGANELCNGRDDDCSGGLPTEEIDYDGDGYPACAYDCNEGDPSVCPGCPEVPDGKDNDCDGEVDEQCGTMVFSYDGVGTGDLVSYLMILLAPMAMLLTMKRRVRRR